MFPCLSRLILRPVVPLCLLAPVTTLAGTTAKEPAVTAPAGPTDAPSGRGRFYFSAGWMWRETGGIDIQARSRGQHSPLPRFFPASGAVVPSIGDTGSFADRVYRDGRVLIDGGTALDGTTSHWAYEQADQVQGGSLQYHAAGRRWESEAAMRELDPVLASADGSGSAPVVELGWERAISDSFALGAQFQWSFLDIGHALEETRSFARQTRSDSALAFTDTYDLQGMVPPEAPYAGAGAGFGPLLDNRPTRRDVREEAAGGSRVVFADRLAQEIDIRLHTFSAGPTVRGQIGPLSGVAGLGVALNVVDWQASQDESLEFSRDGGRGGRVRAWSDRGGETEVLAGFYLQGGLTWAVTPSLRLSAFGRRDWSESLDASLGLSSFSFDPGGWSGGVLVGWSWR